MQKYKDLIKPVIKRILKLGVDEESNQLVSLVINTVLTDLLWEECALEEELLANEARLAMLNFI